MRALATFLGLMFIFSMMFHFIVLLPNEVDLIVPLAIIVAVGFCVVMFYVD